MAIYIFCKGTANKIKRGGIIVPLGGKSSSSPPMPNKLRLILEDDIVDRAGHCYHSSYDFVLRYYAAKIVFFTLSAK